MSDVLITAKCEAGHEQTIRMQGTSVEYAKSFAGLMDGTSPFYVRSPIGDPTTLIGRCGICRAPITCSVAEANSLEDRVEVLEHDARSTARLGPNVKQDEELERAREELVKRIIDSVPGPADRSAQSLTDATPVPEDRSHTKLRTDGQQEGYVVLADSERKKGFVRPYRDAYRHLTCGKITIMGRKIAETYARDPGFYSGTFCSHCGTHFPVGENGEFVWYEMNGSTGPKVGT